MLRRAGLPIPGRAPRPEAALLWGVPIPPDRAGDDRGWRLRGRLEAIADRLGEDPRSRTEPDVVIDLGPDGVVVIEVKHRSPTDVKDGAYAGWDRYYPADSPLPYAPAVRASGCYELARNWRFGLELAAEPDRPFTLACLGPDGLFRGEGAGPPSLRGLPAGNRGGTVPEAHLGGPARRRRAGARVAREVRRVAGLHPPRGGPMSRDQGGSRPEGRLIAVGDIHGCSTALQALIGAIDPRPEDTVVSLGDFIDYGPDTRGVVEELLALSGRCKLVAVMGNHEEMLLDALDSPSGLGRWLYSGGETALNSYGRGDGLDLIPDAHAQLVRGCRDYYETGTHIFVHANYVHRLPMDRIGSTWLRWEFLEPHRLCPHFSGKRVVVGHTPQVSGEVLDLGFLVCLDTDCSRGGWLSALDVGTGRVIQANQRGQLRRRAGRRGPGSAVGP